MKPNKTPSPSQQERIENFARELSLILRRLKEKLKRQSPADRKPKSE
jgi:hypothetical protein